MEIDWNGALIKDQGHGKRGGVKLTHTHTYTGYDALQYAPQKAHSYKGHTSICIVEKQTRADQMTRIKPINEGQMDTTALDITQRRTPWALFRILSSQTGITESNHEKTWSQEPKLRNWILNQPAHVPPNRPASLKKKKQTVKRSSKITEK